MALLYVIPNGQTVSESMSLDFDGAAVTVLYYDAGGLPVSASGTPVISRSIENAGNNFTAVGQFAHNDWRFDGPCCRIKVSLAGVTGYTTYKVMIWRTDDPLSIFPDGAFTGLRALTTQPYTEANVKNGVQYNLRAVWPMADTIGAGTSRKLFFQTTTKPVIVKLRELQYLAEELRIELFQSPTGVTGGTPLAIHNYNGVNPVATTVSATKNVTTVTNGTQFDTTDPEYFFGSANAPQRQTGSIPQGRERVLPANSTFLVMISNTGTGEARVQYFLDWYEGGADLPL